MAMSSWHSRPQISMPATPHLVNLCRCQAATARESSSKCLHLHNGASVVFVLHPDLILSALCLAGLLYTMGGIADVHEPAMSSHRASCAIGRGLEVAQVHVVL